MYSCDACPKRTHCRRICPEIEKLLPPADGRPRANLNAIDRSVVWRVQENEGRLTPRQKLVARLYYRFGVSQELIARLLGMRQPSVCDMLGRIRRNIEKSLREVPIKTA